ncbi:hypothetical protein ACVWZL_005990 [Bradyrhizobium sp. GM2.4]
MLKDLDRGDELVRDGGRVVRNVGRGDLRLLGGHVVPDAIDAAERRAPAWQREQRSVAGAQARAAVLMAVSLGEIDFKMRVPAWF